MHWLTLIEMLREKAAEIKLNKDVGGPSLVMLLQDAADAIEKGKV